MGAELSKDDMTKLAKNSHFTEEELQAWHQHFIQEFPEGKIGKEAFFKVFDQLFPNSWQQVYPQGNAAAFREHMFRTCDHDKNGTIDFKEAVAALDVMCYGTLQDRLEMAFHMYDIDSNGSIDPSEMTTVVGAIYEMVGGDLSKVEEHSKMVFGHMDLNQDGKISKTEFVKACVMDAALCEMLGCQT